MRPHKLWDWVGPPTWKRSGTLVFSAVMGVLLVGGTAMAANLGLLTFTASGDRGHRLEVPRPPLSVTLPTTESAPPIVDSTSAEDVEETDVDDDDGTNDSRADEGSTTENPENESDDGMEPTSDQADDDADEADDDEDDDDDSDEDESDDDDEARSERESDEKGRHRAKSDESGLKAGAFGANGDGRLDDD